MSEALCECAYSLGLDLSKLSTVENPENYTNKVHDFLKKQGQKEPSHVEIMVEYGFRKDPELISSLVVCDGDLNRVNRKILFNSSMKYIGLSVHEHSEFDYILVIILSDKDQRLPMCQCMIF